MRSIRTTITAVTIVMILTSILSVFAGSYLIIRSETEDNSVTMLNLINQDAEKALEKYFESIEQSVEVASNIAIDDIDSTLLLDCGAVESGGSVQTQEQAEVLDKYLGSYCGKIQQYFSGVADYTQGVTSFYYCIDPELSQTQRGFYYKKIGKTGFIQQEPLDPRTMKPAEMLSATWYDAAVSQGSPSWLGPYLCEDEWVCSYFVPIFRSGILIGVMGMDLPCDTLIEQVSNIQIYNTGFVCLLNEEGRIIYHPDLPIASDVAELGLDIRSELLRKKTNGNELMRYTNSGQERQLSFSTLSNGMKVICVAPAGEINAPWIRLIHSIALITVAAIALAVLLIMFLMRAITRPLMRLTEASRRLANEDYDVELTYQGKNEIGTLTNSFNQMRDQIRRYISDLNHQLYHDKLTDLPNMRHFFTLAEEERQRLRSEGKQSVMVYFDIIGLRHYNRQFGFAKGDQLIVSFASLLCQQFGKHRVCRFDGSHFAAVTDEERVEEQLRDILQTCESFNDGQRMPVRAGVYPDQLEEVNVNLACDRAKYACDQNKGELSSSIIYFDEAMLKKGELQRHIINNLDQALEEGWVRVYYQPIVRTADGNICDEEALARWIDPVMGFLSPADFIPALESSKLIYKLDLYVLDQVLFKMKQQQQQAGFYLVPQSINLSRMDFESCDVVEEIRRRVDEAGIDRSMITVEITESVIGGDFDFMKEQVRRFQELGFPVWMDDFGSGYSSLDVLQQVHFDLIKFDMRFMERFDEGNEGRIILTELMNMAISLGTETVCEGVEHSEQVEFLREIGCTRIQGYYYGKPVPFEGIVALSQQGSGLQFENPEEADYYTAIGRINLYDISALSDENDDSMTQYFNTLPMCIVEVNGSEMWFNRCNRSYRDFLERTMGVEFDTHTRDTGALSENVAPLFFKALIKCSKDGNRIIIDETLGPGTVAHTMIRRIAVNPVTGTAAIAVVVLALSRDAGAPETEAQRQSAPSGPMPQYMVQEVSKVTELQDTIASLMDNMPCMTFTKLAKTGVYLACNQAFAEYAHKESPAGVIGLTDAEIFDAETAAHFVEDDRKALAMDQPYIFFEDVPDAAGNPRKFQTTKLKYYNFDSQLCILGMCQDVTGIVRVER